MPSLMLLSRGAFLVTALKKILLNVHILMAQTSMELQISTAICMDFNLSPSPETGLAALCF